MFRKLIATFFGLAMLGMAGPADAAIITEPTALSPGDQYRLAFVTTTTRDATSSNIADYNAFVTANANSVGELNALGTTWTAIASTASVDARDNTGTNPGVSTGVPIYRLDGTKIAADNADLWDGSLLASLSVFSNGNVTSTLFPWTGSLLSGISFSGQSLGTFFPIKGGTPSVASTWISNSGSPGTGFHEFYALSAPLTVVPLPAALPLMGSGLALLGLLGWRRKRTAAA